MKTPDKLGPIYFDQNIFSRMRSDDELKETLIWLSQKLRDSGAIIVYSSIHIDECKASNNPSSFIEVFEQIEAHLLEREGAQSAEITLHGSRSRELLLAEIDATDLAAQQINQGLKFLHFASGWIDELSSDSLIQEVTNSINDSWKTMIADLPQALRSHLEDQKNTMLTEIKNIPLDKFRDDAATFNRDLRRSLPQNYAQLDEVPAEHLVEFILDFLPHNLQTEIRHIYPKGFWADIESREEGGLIGLALMLFHMGAIRDKRVRKGSLADRHKYYLGQFRDCQHIEEASRCRIFATLDKGAARLARAVYAYAGSTTEVLHIRETATSVKTSPAG